MNASEQSAAYDLAIIGGGPVGLTAANLAIAHGLRTLIVEKERKPFPLPRAIHFNGDVLRIFQMAGLADKLRPQIGAQRGIAVACQDASRRVQQRLDKQAGAGLPWPLLGTFQQHGRDVSRILTGGQGRVCGSRDIP